MNLMLAFIVLLVLLRLFERAMEKSVTPFDPFDRIMDYRRHFDRKPRETVGKDVTIYDAIAREQVKRLHDRRRRPNVDNGLRRRMGDQ